MSGLRTNTVRNPDGSLTTTIYNQRGEEVAKMENHHMPVDEWLPLARQYRDQHPEQFGDYILVDTQAESQRKNPGEYGDGKLSPIPGR